MPYGTICRRRSLNRLCLMSALLNDRERDLPCLVFGMKQMQLSFGCALVFAARITRGGAAVDFVDQ